METEQRTMKSNKLRNNTFGLGRFKSRDSAMSGIRFAAILICGQIISGCNDEQAIVAVSEPDPDLNFVRGYRSPSDPCQLTGETSFTIEFLDDASDLVTCPTGDPAATSLVLDNGAMVVTQTNSFTLYSVQRQ